MNTILCLFLAALQFVIAQNALPAMNDVPSAPANVVPATPSPLANAALWQQAVAIDIAKNLTGAKSNRFFYSQVAWWQSCENSSNTDLSGPSDSIDLGPTASQFLQTFQLYPTRFDQAQALDPQRTPIVITAVPQQIITSFGASGAWWPNDLNYFPPEQQQNLTRLLFSEDGLYLSGYRYNMGASGDHDNVNITTPGVPEIRGVESFMNTNGTFDWTRDGTGMYYVKAAAAANVSSITFFVNAAPSGLNVTTENLAPCGGTLQTTEIPAYATYIETVLAHWADQGITIDYISPMNEPDNSFSSCAQEGMAVQQSDRTTVFQQLRLALSNSKSAGAKATKIMGDETSQIASQALMHYPDWLPATLTGQYIDAIAVHMYDFPDDATLLNYAQLIKNSSSSSSSSSSSTETPHPPPVHMTEISSFKSAPGIHSEWGWTGPSVMQSQYDPTMSNALDMARMIWQWLTLVNASSFSWWTAVSTMMPSPSSTANFNPSSTVVNDTGWNDGLIYIDSSYATTKNYNFYLTKRFWVYRHFTTFMRPGSIRYDIPNSVLPYGTVAVASVSSSSPSSSNTSASSSQIWSATFINRNFTDQPVTLRLPGSSPTTTTTTTEQQVTIHNLIQTTDDADWETLPLPTVIDAPHNISISLTLPARGVLTVQFAVSSSSSSSGTVGPLSGRHLQVNDDADRADDGKRQHKRRLGKARRGEKAKLRLALE